MRCGAQQVVVLPDCSFRADAFYAVHLTRESAYNAKGQMDGYREVTKVLLHTKGSGNTYVNTRCTPSEVLQAIKDQTV